MQDTTAKSFDSQEPQVSPNNSGGRVRALFRTSLFITCGILVAASLVLLVVPTLDGLHSRRLANEAAAASKLRTIIRLQDQYMADHAYSGFACELPLLKPTEKQNEAAADPLRFLTTGSQYGYKFSLFSCGSDANKARNYYQVTAVPVEHGAGLRAFCADESGVIWDDEAGSATNCLASRRGVQ
jgi:hypothetical protein